MKVLAVFMIGTLCFSDVFVKCSGTNTTILCSFQKRMQECLCVYKNDPSSVFPVLYADCSRMELTEFPKINDVEVLDISHNSIDVLDPFKTSFESSKIRSLQISFNRLHFVYQDFFKDMPNLKSLDLSNNELVKFPNSIVFRGLRKLEVLNLRSNLLSTLPDDVFETLENLQELDVSYNYLGSLFTSNKSLFTSNLGLNSNIRILKLEGLEITSISSTFFDGASNLNYLSLADNPLTHIPNVPNTLTYLDISGSDITKLRAQELTCNSLKILKLNRLAKLEAIEDYAFDNLKMLEELHLNDCKKLKQLNFQSFGIVFSKKIECSINKLFVARSGLRTITSKYLDIFKSMEYVDLENNPWTCDCDILWLHELNVTYFQDANLRCATPTNLLNRKLMKLTEKDFSSCSNTSNYYQTILIAFLCCLVAVLAALILYLIYLGPLYNKNQYRNIGPQSPYNGNTISRAPLAASIQQD